MSGVNTENGSLDSGTHGAATIAAYVDRSSRYFADREALADGDTRLTHAELGGEVRTIARALLAVGVAAGDRVCIWAPNTHHWVLAALGAQYAGATLVPINTRFKGPEAADVLRRSRARVLVVAEGFLDIDYLGMLRSAAADEGGDGPGTGPVPGLPDLETVVTVPLGERGQGPSGGRPHEQGVLGWQEFRGHAAQVPEEAARQRADAVSPDDVSDILFTSGTTGRPKGAMSAHRQAIAVAAAWAECTGVTAGDRYLIINPFFHSFGYKAGFLVCLMHGATVVPQASFDTDRVLETVHRERVTVLPGPPTIYQTILDHPDLASYDISSLRVVVTGAATVPVRLVERMRSELAIATVLTAYGLTEAVVATMCRPGDPATTVAHTSGRATADLEVAIAGESGALLGPDETGEIVLRGPNVMLGYLDDPQATRAAVDGDGWLHTGDVGHLDEQGNLSITDRLKDMFTVGGFNVYPAEVEQVLAELGGVAESAVVGVSDERMGEVGKAYIVPRPGHSPNEDEVIAFCRERVANFKVPRSVELVTQLPRNAGGKVLKRQLREKERE